MKIEVSDEERTVTVGELSPSDVFRLPRGDGDEVYLVCGRKKDTEPIVGARQRLVVRLDDGAAFVWDEDCEVVPTPATVVVSPRRT